MHILSSIILILGALIVLILGLVSVLHDLLERGPYEVPLIDQNSHQDGMGWSPLFQEAALSPRRAKTELYISGKSGGGSSTWTTEPGES
jgi:hypothetical protein